MKKRGRPSNADRLAKMGLSAPVDEDSAVGVVDPDEEETGEDETEPDGDEEAPPQIEGVTDSERRALEAELRRLKLDAFLPDFRFNANAEIIVPGEHEHDADAKTRRTRYEDETLIKERANFLASVPEWKDQFTYVAIHSGFKAFVWFPGLHRKTVVPDPVRMPQVTETIPEVKAKLKPYTYDANMRQKLGRFCILEMPEVAVQGKYDPFFLKLLFESASNAAWAGNGGTVHLLPAMKPVFDKKVAAEILRKQAEAESRAPLSPRAMKTGRDPALAAIVQKVNAGQAKALVP